MTFNSLFFLFAPIKCVFLTQIETGKMYTSLTHYLLLVQILLRRARLKKFYESYPWDWDYHLCSDSWIIDSIVAKNTIFENDMNVYIDNPLNDTE